VCSVRSVTERDTAGGVNFVVRAETIFGLSDGKQNRPLGRPTIYIYIYIYIFNVRRAVPFRSVRVRVPEGRVAALETRPVYYALRAQSITCTRQHTPSIPLRLVARNAPTLNFYYVHTGQDTRGPLRYDLLSSARRRRYDGAAVSRLCAWGTYTGSADGRTVSNDKALI